MAISSQFRKFQTVLFSSLYFCLIACPRYSLSLNFNIDFTKDFYFSNINCTGDALEPQGDRCQDLSSVGLTKNKLNGISRSVGKAFYGHSVPLWDTTTGVVTSFNTTFSFQIQPAKDTDQLADGLAFFLSTYPPPDNTDGCGFLGLFNQSTMLNLTSNQFLRDDQMLNQTAYHTVAVEFDTYYNWWDPIEANSTHVSHIGIDVNNISSTVYEIIPDSSFTGNNMTAQISYNNLTQNLSLHLSIVDYSTTNFNIISTIINLSSILPNEVAIGFSAATGCSDRNAVELNQLYSWSFNSTLEMVPSTNSMSTLSSGVRGALIASAAIVLLLGTFL